MKNLNDCIVCESDKLCNHEREKPEYAGGESVYPGFWTCQLTDFILIHKNSELICWHQGGESWYSSRKEHLSDIVAKQCRTVWVCRESCCNDMDSKSINSWAMGETPIEAVENYLSYQRGWLK